MFTIDPKDVLPIGDTADTLVAQAETAGTRLNPAITPWTMEFISSSMSAKANATRCCDVNGLRVTLVTPPGAQQLVTLRSYAGHRVGMFIDPGAYENAYRLAAMLRLCDGVGTDVLHRLSGKLSRILDTNDYPSAKCWLTEGSVMTSERNAKT